MLCKADNLIFGSYVRVSRGKRSLQMKLDSCKSGQIEDFEGFQRDFFGTDDLNFWDPGPWQLICSVEGGTENFDDPRQLVDGIFTWESGTQTDHFSHDATR